MWLQLVISLRLSFTFPLCKMGSHEDWMRSYKAEPSTHYLLEYQRLQFLLFIIGEISPCEKNEYQQSKKLNSFRLDSNQPSCWNVSLKLLNTKILSRSVCVPAWVVSGSAVLFPSLPHVAMRSALFQSFPLQLLLLLISCVSAGRQLFLHPNMLCSKNFATISEQMSYRWYYGAHVQKTGS